MASADLPYPVTALKALATAGVRRAASGGASRLVEALVRHAGRAFPHTRAARWLCYHAGEALSSRFPGAERTATLPWGARLIVPLSDYNGRHLYFHGLYEPHITALVERLLKRGETALDVGANNGYYTALFAQQVGPTGSVHAFECNPTLIHRIARMIVLNRFDGWVRLNPVAVSDRDGAAPFYLGDHLGTTGLSSLVRKSYLEDAPVIPVTTVALDRYLRDENVGEIALLKIDIEGAELVALYGMRQTLADRPPRAILCELSDNRASLDTEGVSFADARAVVGFLREFNYAPFRVVPGGLVPYRDEPVVHGDFCFLYRTGPRAEQRNAPPRRATSAPGLVACQATSTVQTARGRASQPAPALNGEMPHRSNRAGACFAPSLRCYAGLRRD